MVRGLAAATAALLVLLLVPAGASAKRMLPWPSDAYTKRDKRTDTGLRLNLKRADMPRNKDGKPIDPTDMNRADGFSPGSAILVKIPGLDTQAAFRRSKLPPLTNLRRGLAKRSPIVVFNARTRKRHPIWAELDSNAERRKDRLLIIRPARNFDEGQRYVVVLRNLRSASGRRLRGRRWSFTVASERSLAGRMLHIRNQAFRGLGDRNLRDLKVAGRSPSVAIDSVENFTSAQDDRIARKVRGHITVPCYLTNDCAPGGRFRLNRRGLPRRTGATTASFVCNIPRSALDPATPVPARVALYGHGLLGDPDEIDAGNVKSMSNEHNFVFCATAWAGFAEGDVPHLISVLSDFSGFNTVADRMQQGFLNMLFLGRAMIHPDGLAAQAAFQKGGQSVLDTRRLFFDGNSQGGIMGGGLTAVAPDFDRAVLGVPGMNYSTLLQRSVDFDLYAALIYPSYPKVIDRQLWLAQIQLLWDRGEANGYAHHMTTDPLPNTPRHTVLMHVAFGDHQVSDTAAEVEARTIGARAYRPALDAGRSPWRRLQLIPSIGRFPFRGSAIVFWDTGPVRTVGTETEGTNAPPRTNTPNRSGDDPHENPRATEAARRQKARFLRLGGRVVDVCGGKPCYAAPYTGP